jgi:hypothetical protein
VLNIGSNSINNNLWIELRAIRIIRFKEKLVMAIFYGFFAIMPYLFCTFADDLRRERARSRSA